MDPNQKTTHCIEDSVHNFVHGRNHNSNLQEIA